MPDTNDTLLAAGGQEAELHLSYYSSMSPPTDAVERSSRGSVRGFGRKLWESKHVLDHGSINNSVMLTLAGSHESSAEPRIIVSNNDRTVKFFDIAVRNGHRDPHGRMLVEAGQLQLDVPVNHSSISPDGRTLLCVGDSPDVYLHRISGGSRVTFTPMTTLSLSPYLSQGSSLAFTSDGSKFAVASQEGVVVIWDVRSTKPLKVFRTDRGRPTTPGRPGNGSASGWLHDAPWDWARVHGRAPGWGVRSVKFSPAGVGREVMIFTEHTSLLHVVDARTFETEEIVRMPSFESPATQSSPARPRSISPPLRYPSGVASPPPPRIVLFSGALEDTFRISGSDSNGRHPRRTRRMYRREDADADDDAEGIVVIPPLGDREVENDVRRLLGRHGVRSRSTTVLNTDAAQDRTAGEGGADEEMDVDVDELESDCFSSHTPSRASSPAPSSQHPSSSSARDLLRMQRPGLLARRESSGPYLPRRSSEGLARRHRRSLQNEAVDADVDLAGTCFDPSGAFVYVASVEGVAEWRVRGAEQTWWTDAPWA
ncbi:Uncharacterized protein C4G3.03 [Grifola frondosa]|uniref:Uncharacterized protein C4G3.03 n=1 Tax=Grifola frondosa TaxID=5627 RepID=A0A1C7LMZ1_GRIFR|nr:Uncharacterized protein C4G3.03 [Grifola frondosa]